MKRYQDILRDQTSRNFAAKRVNTSMLMLPLRLESKIMERNVDITDEPERGALEAFKALQEVLRSLNEDEDLDVKESIRDAIPVFEKLDLLYAEDKSYLKDLTTNIYNALSVELQDAFKPLIDALDDVTRLTTHSDKEATNFLNLLERLTRMLENTAMRPLFSGHRRARNPMKYSQTARFKVARKRYDEINRWFNCNNHYHQRRIIFLAGDIEPGMVTKSQYAKFNCLIERIRKVLYDDPVQNYTVLTRAYPLHYSKGDGKEVAKSESNKNKEIFKSQKHDALVKSAKVLYDNLTSFINYDVNNLRSSLGKKVGIKGSGSKKKLVPLRYTLLLSKLMHVELMSFKREDPIEPWKILPPYKRAIARRLSNLKEIISATYFTYKEQCDFVVKVANDTYSYTKDLLDDIKKCKVVYSTRLSPDNNNQSLKTYRKRKCLCLRIYPDVVALSQAAKQISREEYLAGKDFWLKYIFNKWDEQNGFDETYRESLWLALCDIYPPYRAAFIVKRTYPKANYQVMCRKAQEFRENGLTIEDFIKEIDDNFVNSFPTTYVDNGEQLFSVPVTDLLPDRFVVHASVRTKKNASRTIIQYGHRLPKQLQVGLDLNNLDRATTEKEISYDGSKQLYLDRSLSWMTDYDEAERMGMAITIPLNGMKTGLKKSERKFEFNEIFVYGISDASTDECNKMIDDLLNAHLYSNKAMDIISFETASNIITAEDAKYAFDSSTDKQRERFKHQPYNCVNPHVPEKGNDLDILDKLFGLKESVLGNLDVPDEPGSAEVELQRRVNKWMIDYMTNPELGSVVNPLLTAIKNSPLLYDYLCNDVLPRGPFPMIRIGDQPYGILPACDFKNLAVKSTSPLAIVKKILLVLTTHWNNILAENIVTCYGKDSDNSATTVTTQDYLRILGNTPRSTSFFKRMMVKSGIIDAEYFRGEVYQKQIEELTQIATNLGLISAEDKDKIKNIIPDYDYVPVKLVDENTHDDACFTVQKALDIDNIVVYILARIMEFNCVRPKGDKGIKLSESPELIRNYVIEFFDIFNYRLDAWLMGILNNKLRMRIKRGSHRLALGCFGWLFNLREEDDYKIGCTNEYILAPSINHAVTGAILRSSYNNSLKNGEAHNYDMGVNLSSERVRTAIRIIEGIQNGLSLGSILGADMERLIHEAWKTTPGKLELDSCIYPLRQRYPLTVNDEDNASVQTDGSPANITVLNGARLLDEYATYKEKGKDAVAGWLKGDKMRLFNGDTQQKDKIEALITIIDKIDDEKDALTDVVLSESVYKLTQGNTEASMAISRALKELQNIPMPEVAEIPITSAQIDGYMLAMLPVDAVCNQPDNLLACIEPKVEAWLRQMMHDPGQIYMALDNPVGNPLSLGDLGISAAEMVYLSSDKASFTHFVEVLSWMKTGVYNRYDSESVFSTTNNDIHAFSECSMAIDELRKLLAAAHPLTNDDLVKTTGLPSEAVYSDMSNEFHHVVGYITRLLVNIKQLQERQLVIQNPEDADYEMKALPDDMVSEAVRVLIDCYRIGNTIALDCVTPSIFVGNRNAIDGVVEWKNMVKDQHTLFQSLQMVYENLQAKLEQAGKMVADDPEHKYTTYMEALKSLLVTGYLVVPSFVPDANIPIQDLAQQPVKEMRSEPIPGGYRKIETFYFGNVNEIDIEEMIGDLALVEQPMMNLHQVRLYQKCDGIDVAPIYPMQLPIRNRYGIMYQWLGAAVTNEDDVMDAFTYMVMNPEHFISASEQQEPQLAGIVIDHWVERIPYRDQTAAVAFGYDQPDAEAPQTLLLAMATKDNHKHWNEKMLVNSLKSAIHMVKCRTVSPDLICKDGWTGGLLPLLEYKDPKGK